MQLPTRESHSIVFFCHVKTVRLFKVIYGQEKRTMTFDRSKTHTYNVHMRGVAKDNIAARRPLYYLWCSSGQLLVVSPV